MEYHQQLKFENIPYNLINMVTKMKSSINKDLI